MDDPSGCDQETMGARPGDGEATLPGPVPAEQPGASVTTPPDAGDRSQGTRGADRTSDRAGTEVAAGDRTHAHRDGSSSPDRPVPTIPGYEIADEVGRGAMGVVYRARQVFLNRPCALKLILAGAHADPVAAVRFLGEAEAVARIQHPNIVQIHAMGDAGGLPFLELEYLAGGSLDRVLDGTPWPSRRAAALVEALALGVAEAHRLQIIHRDLKPSNILMAADGTPKIADFGLAKSLDADSGLTATGSILGTPSYMAPEQAGGLGRQVGPLADVHALGAILYELLVGRPPFRGATVMETLDQVKSAEPVPPSRLVPGVARDIEIIALKCLQKDPGRRYESAVALAEDLHRFQAGEPIRARAVGAFERAWRWCRRHPARAVAAVASAFAIGAFVAFALLYAEGQRRFANEQTRATQRITRLATDLETERRNLATSLKESDRRLAVQLFERGQVAFEKGQIGPGLLSTLEAWRSAARAGDSAWSRAARANLSAWAAEVPPLRAVFSCGAPIYRMALSPDGRVAAFLSDDGLLHLWDAVAAAPTVDFNMNIYGLADFSPDNKNIVTQRGNTLQYRDSKTGRLVSSSPIPHDAGALAISPDGMTLLATQNGIGLLWDLAYSRPMGSLNEPMDGIRSQAFSPDGKTIAIGSQSGRAWFWDVTQRKLLGPPIPHNGRVWAVAFSPDGKIGVTGCGDGRTRFWRIPTLEPIDPPLVHDGEVRIVAFRPDGKVLLTGSVDRTARLWDAATHEPIGPIYEHQGPIEGGAITPDGRWILTAGGDATARMYPLKTASRLERLVAHKKSVRAVAFGPGGTTFLTGSNDGSAQVWDSASGRPVGPALIHPGEVWAAAISPDGRTVLTGCADRLARLWDAASGQLKGEPLQYGAQVSIALFSPDGKLGVTASQDGTARFIDAGTGKPLGEPLHFPGGIDAAAFSRDGRRLALGIDLGKVQLFDVESRTPVGAPIPHAGAVSGVAFGLDGRTIVIAGEDGTARIWDIATHTPVGPPMRHRAWIMAMAVSPDGKNILTGSWDHTAQLWDAHTGVPLGPPFRHADKLSSVAFSPDGTSILTGCDDGKARLFSTIPELPEDLERIGVWTEVLTGLTLDNQGSVQVLDQDTWRSRRQQLEQRGGPPATADSRE